MKFLSMLIIGKKHKEKIYKDKSWKSKFKDHFIRLYEWKLYATVRSILFRFFAPTVKVYMLNRNYSKEFIAVIKKYWILILDNTKIRYKAKNLFDSTLISLNRQKIWSFMCIRKNRLWNKGRYARNRQSFRTGVYWCLWLNIGILYYLYYIFYKLNFIFSFFWVFIFFFILSTILGRVSQLVPFSFFNTIIFYVKKNIFKKFFPLAKPDYRELEGYYSFVTYILGDSDWRSSLSWNLPEDTFTFELFAIIVEVAHYLFSILKKKKSVLATFLFFFFNRFEKLNCWKKKLKEIEFFTLHNFCWAIGIAIGAQIACYYVTSPLYLILTGVKIEVALISFRNTVIVTMMVIPAWAIWEWYLKWYL